jgi:hypothetical protein
VGGGSVCWLKGHQGVSDIEASQRSAATFLNIIKKRDSALGRRQGTGAGNGRCVAMEGCRQKGHLRGSNIRVAPDTSEISAGIDGSPLRTRKKKQIGINDAGEGIGRGCKPAGQVKVDQ